MSKGRTHKTLDQLLADYYRVKKAHERKKRREEDKYAGLHECFRNVHKCNMARKLAYY